MRSIVMAAALALGALCGPASAQSGTEQQMMQLAMQLQSDDPTVRDRAVREMERNPGNYSPFLVFAVVPALAEAGRDEDALRWSYFAQLRLIADLQMAMAAGASPALSTRGDDVQQQMLSYFQRQAGTLGTFTPERRRRVFADAIRMDERTPRLYALGFPYSLDANTPWPARDVVARARTEAASVVRISVESEIRRDESVMAMDREIAAGGVAAEATAFIPEAWRNRVRALRTIRVDDFCQLPVFMPTPAGAEPRAFIAGCSHNDDATPFSRRGRDQNNLRWYSVDTFEKIAETRSPEGYWPGQIAVRRGAALPLYQTSDGAVMNTVLLSMDGSVSVITTPGPESVVNVLSPSGRYALRNRGTGFEVFDFETNSVVFTRERPQGEEGRFMARFSQLMEPTDGQVVVVGGERAPGADFSELVSIDLATRRERRLRVENAVPFVFPTAWGTGQVLVTLQPETQPSGDPTLETYSSVEEFQAARNRTQEERRDAANPYAHRYALVDLATMRVEWTGLLPDAPSPRRGYQCGGGARHQRVNALMASRGEQVAQELRVLGGAFYLETPERGAAMGCAVSADGTRIVVVAPPFAHHYEVSAN